MATRDLQIKILVDGREAVATLQLTDTLFEGVGKTAEAAFSGAAEAEEAMAKGMLKSLREVQKAAEAFGKAFDHSITDEDRERYAQMAAQVDALGDRMRGAGNTGSVALKRSEGAARSLSYVIQDSSGFALSLQTGLMGIGNNISPLIQDVIELKQETGGWKAAAGSLLSSFAGPAGIIAVVSLATTLFTVFGDEIIAAFKGGSAEADALRDRVDELLEDIESIAPKMRFAKRGELEGEMRDFDKVIERQREAIEALRKEQREAQSDSGSQFAGVGEAGEIQAAQRELTQAIDARAFAQERLNELDAQNADNLFYQISLLEEQRDKLLGNNESAAHIVKDIEKLRDRLDALRGERRKGRAKDGYTAADLEREATALAIEAMEEGLDKELAQIDAAFERRKAALREKYGEAAGVLVEQLEALRLAARSPIEDLAADIEAVLGERLPARIEESFTGLHDKVGELVEATQAQLHSLTDAERAIYERSLGQLEDFKLRGAAVSDEEAARIQASIDQQIDAQAALVEARQQATQAGIESAITQVNSLEDAGAFVMQLIRREIAAYLAKAIASSLASLGPLAPIVGPALAAGIVGLFSQLVPAFATGVTNFEGGMALVGERGPELTYLPRGANVITNENTQRLLGTIGALHTRSTGSVTGGSAEAMQAMVYDMREGFDRLERAFAAHEIVLPLDELERATRRRATYRRTVRLDRK